MIHFLATVVLAMPAAADPFETIRLSSGHSVRGEVLKDRDDSIVVDVGVNDVLVIPKRMIVARVRGTGGEPAVAATAANRFGESGDLYATSELSPAPIKDLVKRFGEAVVLVKTPTGLGSGFIIDEAGHCVTNYHVIERETRISVDIFQQSNNSIVERTIADVEILAINPFLDLALLKIPVRKDLKLQRVYFGFEEEIRPGDPAFAVGNPEGLTRSVTQGIISNKNRNFGGQIYLQTTAQINPGNSGGPLFNARGQVIGVTNMKRIFSEGLGFAIPINAVKEFLRNREAFAYNKDNPNTGFRYLDPPRRKGSPAGASLSAGAK